ncbi:unnamed protein product [Tilletia caries]|nr:unnamed protein product [Tilletia caries]
MHASVLFLPGLVWSKGEAQNPCIGPPVDDPLGFRLRGYRLLPAPPTSSGQWPMSAYPEFELLPPPPPTFLSTSSALRAQLPRFSNVDEVVQFARGQVLARHDPMIERTLFFVIIYLGLLLVLANSVIIRLYNSISLANLLHQQPPKDACIILVYVWSPLYLGISWMAWAAAVAGTQNLYIRIKITRRWSIKARIPPWVANMFGVGVPCSCAVAVLLPSILGNRHSENARRLFIEWNKQFATQEAITEDMLIQLQLIWFETIRHVNYLAIAAILWSIFVSITLVIYLYFSIRLVRTLQRHLRRRGAKSGPIQNAMTMSMGVFTTDVVPDGGDEHANRTVLSGNPAGRVDTTSAIASPCVLESQVAVNIEDICPTKKNIQPLARLPPPLQSSPRARPMVDPESRQRDEAGSAARAVLYFVIQASTVVGVKRHGAAFWTSSGRSARARNVELKFDDSSTPSPQKRTRGRPRIVELNVDDASISPPKCPAGRSRKEEVTHPSNPAKRSTKAKTISRIEVQRHGERRSQRHPWL